MPDYRINPPVTQNVSAVPTSNPFESLSQGIQSGASLGFQARKIASQEMIRQAEAEKARAEAKKQEEKDNFDKLKFATEFMTKPYFKGFAQKDKDAMHKTVTEGLNKYLSAQMDSNTPYHDDDSEFYIHFNKILSDPNIDESHRRQALSSVIGNAIQNGVDKEKITQMMEVSKMSLKPESASRQEGVQDRFDQNMDFKKEQTWQRLADKVNTLNASSRKALGIAATANMRADRLKVLADDPNATVEDIRREVIDLEGIMTGGVPHEMSIRYGDISNVQVKISKLKQFILAKPSPANLPEWQNRLKEVANGLKQVDNKIIHDNLGINAVGYRGIINEDKMRWNDLAEAVNATSQGVADNGSPPIQTIPKPANWASDKEKRYQEWKSKQK